MYGVYSWKCDHLRNENCGHWRSAQSFDSIWEKWPHTSNWAKNTFSTVQLFPRRHSGRAIMAFARSFWHGRCQLHSRVHVGTTDRWWRWLAQGHVYNSILKNLKPSLANETTWEIGPLIPSPFGGRNSQVWLWWYRDILSLWPYKISLFLWCGVIRALLLSIRPQTFYYLPWVDDRKAPCSADYRSVTEAQNRRLRRNGDGLKFCRGNWLIRLMYHESRRVGLGTTVEYIERKFKTKA